jgi:hypothetical protein
MNTTNCIRTAARWVLGGVGLAAASYATYVAFTWFRYGQMAHPASGEDPDPMLGRFMPTYEIAERHRIRVEAPADVTYAAACGLDLQRSGLVRAIFKGRELLLRSKPVSFDRPRALRLQELVGLGWGVLAEVLGREIVMGAVTQPWRSDVRFQSLLPEGFTEFDMPGYAKIVWTLAAEPLGPEESIFRNETRVVTTDSESRRRFRRYWSMFSPGILLIRSRALKLVKADAEQRHAAALAAK